jgi:hypothetical protein
LSIYLASNEGEAAMAKEESEFQKLLSEAPAAPSSDTVTVTGALSRTADSAHFVLTLPDGRSVTLEVAAVKSAKRIAGAIGQVLVELELDAKRLPEKVEDLKLPPTDLHLAPITVWWADNPPTFAWHDRPNPPGFIAGEASPLIGAAGIQQPGLAPFVAATPHQAHGHHAHRPVIKPPQFDPLTPPKPPSHDGTNSFVNAYSFDITGLGGFDVITYHNGQPVYQY